MYTRTMLAITLAAGHEVNTEDSTDSRAIVVGRRRGSQHTERVVVTMDQAKKAGWTKNSKYNTEPATMLLARAQSQVCRRVAPDALLGMAYSAEELDDDNPATVSVTRGAGTRTVKRATAPEPEEPELDIAAADAAAEPAQPALDKAVIGMILEPDPITPAQLKKLHAAMTSVGITDRDDGLAYICAQIDREITTSKDLSKHEAMQVIDALEAAAEPTVEPWPETPQIPA